MRMHRAMRWPIMVLVLVLSGAAMSLGRTLELRSDDSDSAEAIIQTLSSKVTMLEAELQAQKQKLQVLEERRDHKVAFTAQIAEVSHSIAIPENGAIPFNRVTLNVGNAYNQNSLAFTAPYDGNYWFYARIDDDSNFRSFEIRRNGHGVNRCDNDSHMSFITCGVVVTLKAGDTVTANHVELGVAGGHVDPGPESLFTGFLIS